MASTPRRTTTVACACGCGSLITNPDPWGRVRRYLPAHAKRPPAAPIVCQDCGETRPHEGRGRCKRCYDRAARTGVFVPKALPPSPLARVDAESRRPVPPQVRCAGCADVPRCDRLAQPQSAYCLRCGQCQVVAA